MHNLDEIQGFVSCVFCLLSKSLDSLFCCLNFQQRTPSKLRKGMAKKENGNEKSINIYLPSSFWHLWQEEAFFMSRRRVFCGRSDLRLDMIQIDAESSANLVGNRKEMKRNTCHSLPPLPIIGMWIKHSTQTTQGEVPLVLHVLSIPVPHHSFRSLQWLLLHLLTCPVSKIWDPNSKLFQDFLPWLPLPGLSIVPLALPITVLPHRPLCALPVLRPLPMDTLWRRVLRMRRVGCVWRIDCAWHAVARYRALHWTIELPIWALLLILSPWIVGPGPSAVLYRLFNHTLAHCHWHRSWGSSSVFHHHLLVERILGACVPDRIGASQGDRPTSCFIPKSH